VLRTAVGNQENNTNPIAAQPTRRQKHRDRFELQVGDRGEEERLFGSVTNLGAVGLGNANTG